MKTITYLSCKHTTQKQMVNTASDTEKCSPKEQASHGRSCWALRHNGGVGTGKQQPKANLYGMAYMRIKNTALSQKTKEDLSTAFVVQISL